VRRRPPPRGAAVPRARGRRYPARRPPAPRLRLRRGGRLSRRTAGLPIAVCLPRTLPISCASTADMRS